MSQPRARSNLRPDHNGTQRAQFESNKKKIYATQTHCGICGNPVDFGNLFVSNSIIISNSITYH